MVDMSIVLVVSDLALRKLPIDTSHRLGAIGAGILATALALVTREPLQGNDLVRKSKQTFGFSDSSRMAFTLHPGSSRKVYESGGNPGWSRTRQPTRRSGSGQRQR